MALKESLLIEIGTEELPPSRLGNLSLTFMNEICQAFNALGISYGKAEHFVTPRRICARLSEVSHEQPSRLVQKRGPALASAYDAKGQPTPAALGFARGCGVEVEQLRTHESSQGAWLVFEQEEPGKKLIELLPNIVEQAINKIPAGKKMRWGNSKIEFLRPIHWIMALHGAQVLPIQVFNLTASNTTRGHRFHFPEPFVLSHADNYLDDLKSHKVMANQQERAKIIEEAIHALATENHGHAIIEDALLDQVSGLVEWPVPLYAHFGRAFLDVPQEALISSMQNHQKCFAIKDSHDKLLPTFILISNTDANPPDNIIKGNERVMQARLSDAKFFYDQDRKTPLISRLEGLKNMIFQKRLGSLYDKSQRIAKLAGFIARHMGIPGQLCERAGKLCKADLLTEMVFEFPELQGIMGSYYAKNDGEPHEVALAIKESYLPRFAKDELPQSPVGICVALADRLDTLIGIFGIGQIPTGDKDPFGLRRQALGILRILIENQIPLDLEALCEAARHGYGNLIDAEIIPQVLTFCFERFRAWYQEQGISVQTLDAVMANRPSEPYDCSRRVLAVNHFQTLKEAQNLSAANKRVRNILQKSGLTFSLQNLPQIQTNLLKEEAEKNLAQDLETLKSQTSPLISEGKYQEALVLLAQLQKPVDTFFDKVMVMTDDAQLRTNRIHLLSHLYALFMQIADISKLAL